MEEPESEDKGKAVGRNQERGKKFWCHVRHYNHKICIQMLRAILQESEAKLEMKIFNPPSIFVWR